MASSDDEGETVHTVSEYEFMFGRDEPISFAALPVEWNYDGTPNEKQRQIFLQGKTDNGLRKIYMQVLAWKFDISHGKPEILVLSKDGYWIKLLKPRRAFEIIIRTILITVHFLHFVKRNPQKPRKALWDHLTKVFSMLDSRPSEVDLVDHMSLIKEAVKRDETLTESKILVTVLEEKPFKRKAGNEDVKSSFIVDDNETEDNEEGEDEELVGIDESDESDAEDDCFDSVCAICDNGGDLYLCEGKCMRSFHATKEDGEESKCASLNFTAAKLEALENADFYCRNCEYKQHQCFACGKLGSSDESLGAEVFQCVNGTCGHFYHPHCVAKLLNPKNEAAAEEQREKIVAGESFACPVHKCFVCGELEERKAKDEEQFAVCRRCPRAYHRKCLPRKIAFAEDVDLSRNIVQRAWEDLLPKRALIYCLKHEIDVNLCTPIRNHIKFPRLPQTTIERIPRTVERIPQTIEQIPRTLERSSSALEETGGPRTAGRGVEKLSFRSNQGGETSRKRLERLPSAREQTSKKQKVVSNIKSDGETSLGSKLYAAYFGSTDSEPVKSSREERGGEYEKTQKANIVEKRIDNSLSLDDGAKKRILDMMKDASSSITLEQIKKRYKAPSGNHSAKFYADNVTLGKVEGSVQSIRAALKKLEKGGSVADAKAVCGNDLLVQTMKWKEKLKVYLAPFLYGTRYTSFGRHFTKMDKLKEIVDRLHWYMQDGDMLVDFCCGSNDFSCLTKKKLDDVGKQCSFKNYDILQAKNDFNFERRDWMGVRPDELPEGSRLIMGLNPPFGVNASLANKFIDKALEFKPKLVILIVPRETQRLDEKKNPYDLIWEDDQMCAGKSFYLPGSVDVNDKQIEDWNVTAPVVYLWSSPDWTHKHKAIAEQHGHLSGPRKNHQLEETVPNIQQESQNIDSDFPEENKKLDELFPNLGEDKTIHTEKQEEIPEQESPPQKNKGNNKNQPGSKNSKKRGGKKKKKTGGSHDSNLLGEGGESTAKYSFSRHSTPPYVPYSQTGYKGNLHDAGDLVRKYIENPCNKTTTETYPPTTNPDYNFRGPSTERPANYPTERTTDSFAYGSRPYEAIQSQLHNNIPVREEPNPWSQRSDYLSYPSGPGFPSPYTTQLNPATNAASTYGGMGSSAMQRYAPRLNELTDHHGQMNKNSMVTGQSLSDTSGGYHARPGFQGGALGFAPGPNRPPYYQQNSSSSGWIND